MSNTNIHPTAIIDPKAELAEGVEVGPYAFIEAGVTLGAGTVVGPYVHIQGISEIGPENKIMSHATIGFPPQHLGYNGEPTKLVVGARNTFREYVNVNRGFGDGVTIIGDDNFFMGKVHIGHDCHLGDRNILANTVTFGGHVELGSGAFVSGLVPVHQFCRIGDLAMVGGMSRINQDVPPYMTVEGSPARVRGINAVGLRRAGAPPSARMEIKRLMKILFGPGVNMGEALRSLNPMDYSEYGKNLIEFCKASKRGMLSGGFGKKGAKED